MLLPERYCPNCKHKLNAAATVRDQDTPEPGDFTVCLYCGHLMVFTDDLGLRAPTDDEIYAIAGRPELRELMHAIDQYRQSKEDGEL